MMLVSAYVSVVWHTLAIYLFLIIAIRTCGRRQLGQLTPIDLVIVLVLGSAVETSLIAGNISLAAGITSAGTLLIANWAVTRLTCRYKTLRRLLSGGPILLVSHGQFVEQHLRRAGLTHADVLEAIRAREADCVEQVRYAVLEPDGEINVVK